MHRIFLRYRRLILIAGFCFLSISLAFYFSDASYKKNVIVDYSKILERKAYAELDLYHSGYTQFVTDFYNRSLSGLSQFARDTELRSSIRAGDKQRVSSILNRFRLSTLLFTTVTVFDAQGTQLYVSSEFPEVSALIGEKFDYRDYIYRPRITKKPYVAEIIHASTGRVIQIFAAPILDSQGDVSYIVTGSITLDRLATLAGITSSFSTHTSVLLDSQGNLILENGVAPQAMTNLKEQEHSISDLFLTGMSGTGEELNYRNERVFYKTSKVALREDNFVFLVSYYPQSQFNSELVAARNSLERIFFQNVLRSMLIIAVCIFSLVFILRNYDQKT